MGIVDLNWYDCDPIYAFDGAFPKAAWGKKVCNASTKCRINKLDAKDDFGSTTTTWDKQASVTKWPSVD